MPVNKRKSVVVVGPQRAGTTWIYELLKRSDHVGKTKHVKELEFFSNNYSKGLNWYLDSFDGGDNTPIVDVSSTYFSNMEAMDRICRIPDIKVIVVYRDPKERIVSLFRHQIINAGEKRSFKDAVANCSNYIESNLYYKYTNMWEERIGRNRLLVLDFEELKNNNQRYVSRICQFVGIPVIENANNERIVNKARSLKSAKISTLSTSISQKLRSVGLSRAVYLIKRVLQNIPFINFFKAGSDQEHAVELISEENLKWYEEFTMRDTELFRKKYIDNSDGSSK